jgi:DNA-binding LytR/AlgR family response regulator
VTTFVRRSDVLWVEAHGDYVRLHTSDAHHLVRVPLRTLEQDWADAGFVRIHRSLLVSLRHVEELRVDSGRTTVRLGGAVLSVSRRHARDVRHLLGMRAPGSWR